MAFDTGYAASELTDCNNIIEHVRPDLQIMQQEAHSEQCCLEAFYGPSALAVWAYLITIDMRKVLFEW